MKMRFFSPGGDTMQTGCLKVNGGRASCSAYPVAEGSSAGRVNVVLVWRTSCASAARASAENIIKQIAMNAADETNPAQIICRIQVDRSLGRILPKKA